MIGSSAGTNYGVSELTTRRKEKEMYRYVKDLMTRAKSHWVFVGGNGHFIVQSGQSGKLYKVNELANSFYSCDCAWGQHNPGTNCSHITAVRMHLDREPPTRITKEMVIVVRVRGDDVEAHRI